MSTTSYEKCSDNNPTPEWVTQFPPVTMNTTYDILVLASVSHTIPWAPGSSLRELLLLSEF